MHLSATLTVFTLSPSVLSLSASASQRGPSPAAFAPSPEHARENAAHIFNAIHSAMRQWGSSIHHNGLGVIPATIPKGTLFYHGSRTNETPTGFEWLAFEMEHAENFARSWRGGNGIRPPRPPGPPGRGVPGSGGGRGNGQRVLVVEDSEDGQMPPPNEPRASRGYLHTYRANRDLRLLYLDGMAAGKTDMGTLDTQDFLLRGQPSAPSYDEFERAWDVCALIQSWGLDGVIRMEIGFEAIYCDFYDGLDQASVLRRPWSDTVEGNGGIDMFEWTRAVGQRYDGIGGGRVRLGFGGMVSGAWYPVNVSNPNGRSDMPRLGRLGEEEREVMLNRVEEVAKQGVWGRVDWQEVVDMIVARHGDRIESMVEEDVDGGDEAFVIQLLVVTNTFVDYPRDELDDDDDDVVGGGGGSMDGEMRDMVSKARELCVRRYLTTAVAWRHEWTAEDGLIFEAVETVAQRICGDLYAVRDIILEAEPRLTAVVFSERQIRNIIVGMDHDDAEKRNDKMGDAVRTGREILRELMAYLGWSLWKKCKPGCGISEVCFVAMWPFGFKQDHYHPSCQNRTAMADRRMRRNGEEYWDLTPRPSELL